MDQFPETRQSLLLRLRDVEDAAAWGEFLDIYRPLIYRLARRRGWQDADAQDVAQKVLIKVAGSIEAFDPDKETRFRTWLSTVCRNTLVDEFRKRRPDAGQGGSEDVSDLISDATREDFDIEQRRAVFRWAAKQIASEFEAKTWEAFRLTSVDGYAARTVADQLGLSVGAVYTARSRVMRRLQQKVREYEDV